MNEVGIIHSSFYVGSVLTVFTSHHLTQNFGAKKLISAGIVLNIVCTWTIPLVAYFAPFYLFTAITRFIMGLGQGNLIRVNLIYFRAFHPLCFSVSG